MGQIKAVFFDQGNVLDDYGQQTAAMASLLGMTDSEFKKYVAPHVRSYHLGLDEMTFLSRVCRDAGVTPPSRPIFRETFYEYRYSQFNRELLDVNAQLRNLGLKTGIISNAEKPLRYILLEEYIGKKPQRFDAVVCSCDAGYAKPDEEIFMIACREVGVDIRNAVFVDDVLDYVNVFRRLSGNEKHGIHHVNNPTTVRSLSDILGHELVLVE